MKQKVTVIMERASDGGYGCYVEDDLPGFGLAGYGDSAEAAKADMLIAYDEIREMQEEEGIEIPELEFVYKYDLQSFFNYFSFLNVSKVAERAGINASLMRRYTSGVANAGEKQYDKIKKVVSEIGHEMASATF
jgi:predicted RNase H-like HicB family nuclease